MHFHIRNEVRSLTSFRFIAALYVFLFHIQIRTPVFGDGLVGGFISSGAVGMTMFFTLSGFILSHAYHSVAIDTRAYLIARFARIYPIYLLAAVLALPAMAHGLSAEAATTSLFHAVLAGVILVVFGLLLIHAWLPQSFVFWNNSASWSISVEAFFYALFPVLRNAVAGMGKRTLLMVFAFLSIISSMIPVSEIVFSNYSGGPLLFYAQPIFRLPEFIAGIVAYNLMRRIEWTLWVRNVLLTVVALGVLHVALLGPRLPSYTLNNWLLIPAVAAALVLLYKAEKSEWRILVGAVPVWLGQISYCFYSFQFHVLEGLRWVVPIDAIGGWTYAALATLLLLAVSAFAHHFVEEPARLWIRRRARRSARTTGEPA
ncbi:MAG: acyltransferase [Maritimibacter sp.]|nr:acyltransferase [Maritimibacter sp.]